MVRLRVDAVRAVGLPAPRGLRGDARARLPRRLHLRGDRPDPRLVLHPDGRRDAGLRRVVVPQRAVPRAHHGRGRPQDVQAPRQHPRADPADGRARRRRGALVHGRRWLAVGGAPGGAHHHPGDGAQGPADVLEHRRVPGALRRHVGVESRRPGTGPRGSARPRPVGALRGTPARAGGDRGDGVASTPSAPVSLLSAYVDDLSNWYVRRSRRRFWSRRPRGVGNAARVPVRRHAAAWLR